MCHLLLFAAELNTTVSILFGIYLMYGIAGFFRTWFFTLAGQRLVARIRVQLFSAIIKQDIEFFDKTRYDHSIVHRYFATKVISLPCICMSCGAC